MTTVFDLVVQCYYKKTTMHALAQKQSVLPVCIFLKGTASSGLPFECTFDVSPCHFSVLNHWRRTDWLRAGPYSDHTSGNGGLYVGGFAAFRVSYMKGLLRHISMQEYWVYFIT